VGRQYFGYDDLVGTFQGASLSRRCPVSDNPNGMDKGSVIHGLSAAMQDGTSIAEMFPGSIKPPAAHRSALS
jgi:hypothetical protein